MRVNVTCPDCFDTRTMAKSDAARRKSYYCKKCAVTRKNKSNAIWTLEKDEKDYARWSAIKSRCYNNKSKDYKYYGERGIVMYEAWKLNFDLFFSYISSLPHNNEGLTIDRIHNDFGYESMNLRWVDMATQNKNRRVYD